MTPKEAKLLADFYGAEAIVQRNDEKWACWPKPLVEALRALVELCKKTNEKGDAFAEMMEAEDKSKHRRKHGHQSMHRTQDR